MLLLLLLLRLPSPAPTAATATAAAASPDYETCIEIWRPPQPRHPVLLQMIHMEFRHLRISNCPLVCVGGACLRRGLLGAAVGEADSFMRVRQKHLPKRHSRDRHVFQD